MTRRTPACSAFTLIELLVTIAIIAILAALTFPSIGKIRDRADTSRCASNLRTLANAAMGYATDHNLTMVPPIENGEEGFRQWMFNTDYLQYLGVPATTDLKKLPSYFLCPTAIKGKSMTGINYGMNISGMDIGPNNFNQPGYVPNTRLISRPSQKIYIIDGLDWWVISTNAGNYAGTETPATQTPAYRHNGRANVAFFDGHVELIPGTELKEKLPLWDIPAN